MPKPIGKKLHSYESGRRAKPDRLEAGLAHLIGAALIERSPHARFNVRVYGTFLDDHPHFFVSGEISKFLLDDGSLADVVRGIAQLHYNETHRLPASSNGVTVRFNPKPQSHDLAENRAAGDQGSPIAVAFQDGPNFLPWERYVAVGLRQLIDAIYHADGQVPEPYASASGVRSLEGLRADGKVKVGALYEGAELYAFTRVEPSVEHEKALSLRGLRDKLGRIITGYLKLHVPQNALQRAPVLVINSNGAWHEGGLKVDDGCSEAKPQEDYFGSHGLNEDAPWGEDPTKPSGPGTIAAFHAARQLVSLGYASYARVSLDYSIGRQDVGVTVDTDGTGTLGRKRLAAWVHNHCPLKIADVTRVFGLRSPALYRQIAADVDLFQNQQLPWNIHSPEYKAQKLEAVGGTQHG